MTDEQEERSKRSWVVLVEHTKSNLTRLEYYCESEGEARARAADIVMNTEENPDVIAAHIYQRAGTVTAERKPVWTGARP